MLASSDPGFLLPFRASPPRLKAYLHYASWPMFDGSVSEPRRGRRCSRKVENTSCAMSKNLVSRKGCLALYSSKGVAAVLW